MAFLRELLWLLLLRRNHRGTRMEAGRKLWSLPGEWQWGHTQVAASGWGADAVSSESRAHGRVKASDVRSEGKSEARVLAEEG